MTEHGNVSFDLSSDHRTVVFSAADGDLYLMNLLTSQVTRLTQTPEHESLPAFSPDGKTVAYVASVPGSKGSGLFLLSIAEKSSRRLTSDPDVTDSHPAFSEDGKQIVFTRGHRYRQYSMGGMVWDDWDVYVVNDDGKALKRLTHKKYYQASSPRFSKEGARVVFSADVPYKTATSDAGSGGSLTTLLHVSTRNPGEPELLIPLPEAGKSMGSMGSSPRFTADGKRLAFLSDLADPFKYDITTMDAEGKNVQRLNIVRIASYNRQPTYFPDGESLLFLAGTETNGDGRALYSLWKVDAMGKNAEEIADSGLFTAPLTWKPRKR